MNDDWNEQNIWTFIDCIVCRTLTQHRLNLYPTTDRVSIAFCRNCGHTVKDPGYGTLMYEIHYPTAEGMNKLYEEHQ